ncbi:valine--tRNA ligase [Candidatus Nesciobacter abundans]|uniref:Valine--tRNA ligase n=1 Tax=Candidatus Nesciobacter abundans TaxID=2601668 RepID=A0A5C0UGP9_9PROT|nr:valine--tRNA ligase [Candidatus Nesciobacter abundans]QEK39296.1 valine--tRNA ligase [Candidatus Nesciobacter abundans]
MNYSKSVTNMEKNFFSKADPFQKSSKYESKSRMVLPPPNITGKLHIGHALNAFVQDLKVRYERSFNNNKISWIPGTDHAGIATQIMVEKLLLESNIKKEDLGREKFLEKVWEWKEKYQDNIYDQLKKLGLELDWDQAKFTMDEDVQEAVSEAFCKFYKSGLIFKDNRIVHWDTKMQTAISDLEVRNEEVTGYMYYIKYYFENSLSEDSPKNTTEEPISENFVTVATTRPETMFGDKAIAVNPNDERYKNLIGRSAYIPMTDIKIPIISDERCDMEKGSGAVKITPAHDFLDFEIGKDHDLEVQNIIDKYGKLSGDSVPKSLQNIDRLEARKKIIKELKDKELLVKEEKIKHIIPHGDRSGSILEPMATKQWFLDMDSMASEAKEDIQNIAVFPQNYIKIFNHWMNNIQPWCISRQIWWGHQIPVWYFDDNHIYDLEKYNSYKKHGTNYLTSDYGQINKDNEQFSKNANLNHEFLNQVNFEKRFIVAKDIESARKIAKDIGIKNDSLTQETDVLDTWFSSALWPLVNSKEINSIFTNSLNQELNQKSTQELSKGLDPKNEEYPNECIITGSDILFFWVARMIMFCKFFSKKIPFKQIYLHGLVQDSFGKKMSKSKNNAMDPLDIIAEEGIDVLRYALLSSSVPGKNVKFGKQNIEKSRHFCIKIWNVFKFIKSNCSELFDVNIHTPENMEDNLKSGESSQTHDSQEIKKQNIPQEESSYNLPENLHPWNSFIVLKISDIRKTILDFISEWKIHEASNEIYKLIWEDFCSLYIEGCKSMLNSEHSMETKIVITESFKELIRILNPFMPVLSTEIFSLMENINPQTKAYNSNLTNKPCNTSCSFDSILDSILKKKSQKENQENETLIKSKTLDYIKEITEITDSIRYCKGVLGIENSIIYHVNIKQDHVGENIIQGSKSHLESNVEKDEVFYNIIEKLSGFKIHPSKEPKNDMTPYPLQQGVLYINFLDKDLNKLKNKIKKEKEKSYQDLSDAERKIENKQFIENAPTEIKEEIKERIAKLKQIVDNFDKVELMWSK